MRSYQVFAAMTPEEATHLLKGLSKDAPNTARQAVDAAAIAIKARPVYLRRQPLDRRAQAVRRALARVASNPVADELLATYFLECRKPLLLEWLDLLGMEHEDGTLKQDEPEQPAESALHAAVDKLRSGAAGDEETTDRELLMRAFAAQGAVEWPALDAILSGAPAKP